MPSDYWMSSLPWATYSGCMTLSAEEATDRRNFYRKALASGLLENESEKKVTQNEADDGPDDCCMADCTPAPMMQATWTSKPPKSKTPTQKFRFNEQNFEEMDEANQNETRSISKEDFFFTDECTRPKKETLRNDSDRIKYEPF